MTTFELSHAPKGRFNPSKDPQTRFSSLFLRVALAAAIGGAAASALGADDSVWINKGIRDALAQGKSEYVLPAGQFNLSSSIVIPDGTRNFTLRGRGREATTFRGNVGIGYAIVAGIQTIMWNNYGVANLTTYNADPAPEGATTLKLASVASIKVGDYLAIWDEGYVKHYSNGDAQRNHSAVIKVTALNAAAKTITIDRPLPRDFTLLPKVSLINDKIVAGLAFKDMGFDATVEGTTGRNNGIVSLGVSDKVSLSNLRVDHFATRALSMNWARDVVVDGVKILDGANAGNPGMAYGITICRSQNVLVQNCQSTDARHSYIATNGSTDVTYQDCIADGNNGNFDTHGFDERRISYIRCKGTGTLNVGNDAYLGGGSDFLVKDSSFQFSVLLYSNVSKFRAINSTFWGVQVNSRFGTKGWPTGGMPQDATFTSCAFNFTKGMYSDMGEFGSLTFDRCLFMPTPDPYALILNTTWCAGKMTFQGCTFLMMNTGSYTPFVLNNARSDFSFTMKDCNVLTMGNAWGTLEINPNFRGTAVLSGNRLYTDRPGAQFMWNKSPIRVSETDDKTLSKAAGSALNSNRRP